MSCNKRLNNIDIDLHLLSLVTYASQRVVGVLVGTGGQVNRGVDTPMDRQTDRQMDR